MASIEQQAKAKKDGDIRYLTPLNIETNTKKKYCRFKKSGIKYEPKKDIQLQFEKYAKNPEFYLGKITNSSEVKSSLDPIKETLLNLGRSLSTNFATCCAEPP